MPRLTGFWSDLLDRGQQALDDAVQTRVNQSGTSAHIDAQNQAVAEMASVSDAYKRGALTNAAAQQQIQAITAGFVAFCQRLGYARALAGAADVSRLSSQLVSDLKKEAIGTPGGTIPTLAAGLNLSNVLLYGGGALLTWRLLKGR